MTAARMVARLAGRCRWARRRAHERRRLPLTPGSRRPACCGVRSEPDPLALARARCVLSQATDWMDRKRASAGACSTSSRST